MNIDPNGRRREEPTSNAPASDRADGSRRRFVSKLVKVGTVAIPVIVSASIQSRAHAS